MVKVENVSSTKAIHFEDRDYPIKIVAPQTQSTPSFILFICNGKEYKISVNANGKAQMK